MYIHGVLKLLRQGLDLRALTQKFALNSFAWGTFALHTPMQLWNEEPAAEVAAHSRFSIEEDGRIAPNVTGTFVDRYAGRFVLGLDKGRVVALFVRD